jgi:hypothetical protein
LALGSPKPWMLGLPMICWIWKNGPVTVPFQMAAWPVAGALTALGFMAIMYINTALKETSNREPSQLISFLIHSSIHMNFQIRRLVLVAIHQVIIFCINLKFEAIPSSSAGSHKILKMSYLNHIPLLFPLPFSSDWVCRLRFPVLAWLRPGHEYLYHNYLPRSSDSVCVHSVCKLKKNGIFWNLNSFLHPGLSFWSSLLILAFFETIFLNMEVLCGSTEYQHSLNGVWYKTGHQLPFAIGVI